MARNILNDRRIVAAKPKATVYRLADGGGLYLRVSPTGAKSWEFRYRHDAKQQTASLGKLDAVSLAEARIRAQEARELAAKGEHLTVAKNVAKAQEAAAAGGTFAKVAADWIVDEARRKKWTEDYRQEAEASLRNHLNKLDTLPVSQITAAICSPLLRKVERSAPDTATKVRQRLRSILDFAVEHGLIAVNPLPVFRRGPKIERKHLSAVLTTKGSARFCALLTKRTYQGECGGHTCSALSRHSASVRLSARSGPSSTLCVALGRFHAKE